MTEINVNTLVTKINVNTLITKINVKKKIQIYAITEIHKNTESFKYIEYKTTFQACKPKNLKVDMSILLSRQIDL